MSAVFVFVRSMRSNIKIPDTMICYNELGNFIDIKDNEAYYEVRCIYFISI